MHGYEMNKILNVYNLTQKYPCRQYFGSKLPLNNVKETKISFVYSFARKFPYRQYIGSKMPSFVRCSKSGFVIITLVQNALIVI